MPRNNVPKTAKRLESLEGWSTYITSAGVSAGNAPKTSTARNSGGTQITQPSPPPSPPRSLSHSTPHCGGWPHKPVWRLRQNPIANLCRLLRVIISVHCCVVPVRLQESCDACNSECGGVATRSCNMNACGDHRHEIGTTPLRHPCAVCEFTLFEIVASAVCHSQAVSDCLSLFQVVVASDSFKLVCRCEPATLPVVSIAYCGGAA